MQKRTHILNTFFILVAIVLVAGLVAGCGTAVSVEPEAIEPAIVAQAAPEPTAAPLIPLTTDPVAIEPAEASQPDNCVDCHTDKDLLIDTADPEEEVISENEGEG